MRNLAEERQEWGYTVCVCVCVFFCERAVSLFDALLNYGFIIADCIEARLLH
jgi:hypothetical protein